MTRYIFSVWYKGEKPIYKPPYPAGIVSETVEYNVNNSGLDLLTVVHDMDVPPTNVLFDPHQVVDMPTGGASNLWQMELYKGGVPASAPKVKNQRRWKKHCSPNLRREF